MRDCPAPAGQPSLKRITDLKIMSKLRNKARQKAGWFLLLWGTFALSACSIKEDFSDCIVDEYLLYVKVMDDIPGTDITETGKINNTYVYLFNTENKIISIYELNASRIASREPIVLYGLDPTGIQVVAWGNMGKQIDLPPTQPGDNLDELQLSLKPDPATPGYNLLPDEIFFGSEPLDFITRSKAIHSQEIVIRPKNARLHITVRGLDVPETEKENNNYFRISTPHNGYTFGGMPTNEASALRGKGTFENNGEYVTPEAWQMIHSIHPETPAEDDGIRVEFYRESPGGDRLLAGADTDHMGNYITLTSGRTTNILLDTGSNGQLDVRVEVTPWDEIYQWSIH